MNNNRKRVFRIRQNKGGFRRRGGGQNQNLQINSFNNNRSFNKNGSMSNPANVEKAIQKYNQLAKDAQSSGDLILVQNYLQHADHFSRILSLQELSKSSEEKNNIIEQNFTKSPRDTNDKKDNITNLENLDKD